MNKPILAKENHQLIDQLEQDVLKLLTKFKQDTGLLVTCIDVIIQERQTIPPKLCTVEITGMVKGT